MLGAEPGQEPRVVPSAGLMQEMSVLLQLHVTSCMSQQSCPPDLAIK